MRNTLNMFTVLVFVFVMCQGCEIKEIVLNQEVESELLDFNKLTKNSDLRKFSIISMNFDQYNGVNRFAITLSNLYDEKENEGLFYLDSLPVLLYFERDSPFDRDKLGLIIKNADYSVLKNNLEDFIKSHEEKPQDSFDPPYVLFNIIDGKLVKAN